VTKRDVVTQANELVDALETAKETAEELREKIAQGIRAERRAGLQMTPSPPPPVSRKKPVRRATKKTR